MCDYELADLRIVCDVVCVIEIKVFAYLNDLSGCKIGLNDPDYVVFLV